MPMRGRREPHSPPAPDDPRALDEALADLVRLTSSSAGAIAVPAPGPTGIAVVAEWRLGEGAPASETVLAAALRTGAVEPRVDDPPASQSVLDARIATVLSVPVRRGGRTLAVVYLDRRGIAAEPFEPEAVSMAAALARALAVALDFAGRLEEVDRARQEAIAAAAEARSVASHVGDFWQLGEYRTYNAALRTSLELAEKAAASDLNVLVVGETGTGKEYLARCIHAASPRRRGPFHTINAAALPASLMESEVLGIEGSVATGVSARRGVFEMAQGGTLLLDEIGDLPLELQPKLLRVVESKRVRRIGGSSELPVDVRLVAATHRDLAVEVAQGRFREDLFYRLAVVSVHIPPLRQRPEDVPELARRMLAAAPRGPELELTTAAIARLVAHPWPGNIRELRNVCDRIALLSPAGAVGAADVESAIRPGSAGPRDASGAPSRPPSRVPAAAPTSSPSTARTFREHMDEHARSVIESALREGGSITGAARLLGITRQTLSEKLQGLGIAPPAR